MSKKIIDGVVVSAVIGFFVLFFAPLLITHTRMFAHDTIWFYGIFHYFADQLLQGTFPYWDPYDYCGQPFYTNLSIMHLTNPLTLIVIMSYKVFHASLLTLYHWNFMLEILFSGIGVYLFSKAVNRSRFTHFFMMFVFLFSSFTYICLRQAGFLYAFLFLPWVLLFMVRLVRDLSLFNIVGLGLFAGLAMGGYQGLFVIVFVAVFKLSLLINKRGFFAGSLRRSTLPLIVLCLLIIALLSGPLLSVFIDKNEFAPMARERMSGTVPSEWSDFRGLVDRGIATHGYFDKKISLSEGFLFIGFLPLILAFLGLFAAKDEFKLNFLITLCFTVFLMVGDKMLLQRLVNHVFPPFQYVRHMQLLAGFFIFNMIYFSGKGCDWLLDKIKAVPLRNNTALCIGLITFIELFSYGKAAMGYATLPRQAMQFSELPTEVKFDISRKRRVVRSEEIRYFKPLLYKTFTAYNAASIPRQLSGQELSCDIFTLLEGCFGDGVRTRRFSFYKEAKAKSARDLVVYGTDNFLSWDKPSKLAFLDILSVVLDDIARQKDFYSAFKGAYQECAYARGLVQAGYKELLLGSTDWSFRKRAGISIVRILDLAFDIEPQATSREYDLFGKRYTFAQRAAIHARFFKVMPVYDYLEFVWTMNHVEEFTLTIKKDYRKLLEAPLSVSDMQKKQIIVDTLERHMGIQDDIIQFYGRESAPGSLADEIGVHYEVTEYTTNTLGVSVEPSRDCLLCFSEGYDKYWSAFVDGKKTRVIKANGAFMAVRIPQGRHSVRFVYSPGPFKIALALYYLTIGGCVVYLISVIGISLSGKSCCRT